MKILHYSLGFPPYRTGGMTKYCMDLIEQQIKLNNEVVLLWPGRIRKNNDSYVKIENQKPYKFDEHIFCRSCELINPLPIPLLNGIKDTSAFMHKKNIQPIVDFLDREKFDVIHVHTLMGLPIEFLELCKKKKIKTIFTTHDYFGLCFKCSFMCGSEVCNDDQNCGLCVNCNNTALSLKKIRILQSSFYRVLKNNFILKKMRKKTISLLNENYENMNITASTDSNITMKYIELRNYYKKMLELIDIILFNSSNTYQIYSKYLNSIKDYRILAISNSMVKENNKMQKKVKENINIGYLGPISSRKGFFSLYNVLNELYNEENKNFTLHLYTNSNIDKEYIQCHEPYNEKTISNVMNEIDVIVVPSKWYETFGFTVLEALSYGVPVIVSNNVGAKDLVNNHNGFIYNSESELKKIVKNILNTPEIVQKLNSNIYKMQKIKTMEEHNIEILKIYNGKE